VMGCPRKIQARGYASPSRPSMALSLRAQQTMALWCPLYVRIASPAECGAAVEGLSLAEMRVSGCTRWTKLAAKASKA
jgi:hypothetical protein